MPAKPRHFIARPRLNELLTHLSDYPVTALVAPAGAGKTTLAADWLRRLPRAGAWLTLDEADREPRHLVESLSAVLDRVVPGVADAVEAELAALRSPSGDDTIHVLVNVLEDLWTEPVMLVLDDVHRLDTDPTAAAATAAFVEHKPDWLGLMLISRRRLPLPVDRLRAAGTLADVTFEALKFTDAEATQLLTGLCPDASPQSLPDVTAWADGWAAAIQLAALAVRSRREAPHGPDGDPRETPAGSDGIVVDYLWHEVLAAERPQMIDLLLDVAVVEQVNYPIAEALTLRADTGDLLAEAENRGLFLTKVDGGWFEMHRLVRHLLLNELERRWPDRVRRQHVRAAEWFESDGDRRSALDHWMAAGMHSDAVRILASLSSELFEAGQADVIREKLDSIAPHLVDADSAALIDLAWCQLFVDKNTFELAVSAAEDATAEAERSNSRLMTLRSMAALIGGDWNECERYARSALELVEEPAWLDTLGQFGWSLVAHGIALDERWDDASPDVTRARAGTSHHPQRAIALEGTRAIGLALSGNPYEALRTTTAGRQSLAASGLSTVQNELTLGEAVAARELGDKTQARRLLEELTLHPSYPNPFIQLTAQLELVALHLSNGEIDEADRVFHAASEACESARARKSATDRLARSGVMLETSRGDLDAAERWARRIEDPFWRPIGEVRVAAARHDHGQAAKALKYAKPRCARHEVIRNLMAASSMRHDDRAQAEKSVLAACELAAERGMLETVGTEGREVSDLFELAAWRVPDAWMQRLRSVITNAEVAAPRQLEARSDILTAREREVLRLLPSRLTLHEVASELFVSHNTLKFHLRVIYQKLGVNSRAEAVDAARQLGLLRRA